MTESNYSHKSLPAAGCTEPQTTPTIFLRTDGKISHVSFNVYFKHHGYVITFQILNDVSVKTPKAINTFTIIHYGFSAPQLNLLQIGDCFVE